MSSSFKQLIKDRIHELEGRKVLIVGDIGLDEYVVGDVSRISPEAPVPVVEVEKEDARLGLSANVAANIESLGGKSYLVGVVGQDDAQNTLRRLLSESRVSSDFLIEDKGRPTTRKMRVIAGHQQVVRVDYEKKKFLSADIEAQVLKQVISILPDVDAVILEDYAKGVLSENVCQQVISLAKKAGKKVLVDPSRTTPLAYYKGADLFKPNRDEAIQLSGLNLDQLHETDESINEVGQALLEQVQSEYVVITQGKLGMSLLSKDKTAQLPTYAREVFDVTGAGDTVIAALGLAWASGFELELACAFANFAAGVVVGKVGCVPCGSNELIEYVDRF